MNDSSRKFVIKKDAKTDVITYMEYEKLKGFNVKPKNNVSFDDMINVNEMVVINPSLIEKLVDKKCKRTFEKLVAMISVVYEEDDDSDETPYIMILDEMERFRSLLLNKYKEYIEEKEFEVLIKKLEILKEEVELRKRLVIERQIEYEVSKKGKSSR